MNKFLYKQALKNINVSEATVQRVISKSGICASAATAPQKKPFKLLIPVAAVLAVSVITVSAAPRLGIDTVFRSFYSQFFGTSINDKQADIIERYGYSPNKTYTRDGVTFSVDGVIGDSSLLYVKYSVQLDKGYDPDIHSGILANKLYLGDLKKGFKPFSVTTSSLPEKSEATKFNYSAIYNFEGEISSSEKNATLVMTFPDKYTSTDINLSKAYSGQQASDTDSSNITAIPNDKLNLPLETGYGKILLESVGYSGGSLVLAVDSSGYYKTPSIFLRDKNTSSIYNRNDGFVSVSKDNLEYIPFAITDKKLLGSLEIVMPEEFYLSFPLHLTDNIRTFDVRDEYVYINEDTRINQIKLSPLSITITGTVPEGRTPGISSSDCSLHFKDGSVLSDFKGGSIISNDKTGSFTFNIPFGAPLEIQDANKLIILPAGAEKPLEIPLS